MTTEKIPHVVFLANECIGCGTCLEACKGGAFSSAGSYGITFDESKCIKCNPCAAAVECLNDCIK